jgi:hypothetical protein
VQLLPDDRPPTRKQEQLITKLVKDFPDAKELVKYSNYESTHTKSAVSAFITTAIEVNQSVVGQAETCMTYIVARLKSGRRVTTTHGKSTSLLLQRHRRSDDPHPMDWFAINNRRLSPSRSSPGKFPRVLFSRNK